MLASFGFPVLFTGDFEQLVDVAPGVGDESYLDSGRPSITSMRTMTPRRRRSAVPSSTLRTCRHMWFRTYSVGDKVLTLKVDASTWPSWTGTEQKRNIILSGDELKWSLAASVGGTAEVVLRRVK